jgi:hypothetical protein
MTPVDRKAYVDKKTAERAAIQAQIRTLSEERAKLIAAARAKDAGSPATLDRAMVEMVGAEAAAKGYSAGK